MKRWKGAITKCLVFLLLGAVVNVGVSLGLSFTAQDLAQCPLQGLDSGQFLRQWQNHRPSGAPPSPERGLYARGRAESCYILFAWNFDGDRFWLGDEWLTPPRFRDLHPLHPLLDRAAEDEEAARLLERARTDMSKIQEFRLLAFVVQIREAGWPFIATRGDVRVTVDQNSRQMERISRGAFVINEENSRDSAMRSMRFLPLQPLWPGFAVNTVFYAVILWLVVCGSFALRRIIRRKRGRCIKCGYDLRGDLDAGCPECGWNRAAGTHQTTGVDST